VFEGDMKLVVGDVHGCYHTLLRLLEKVGWSAGRDELWCVGDMVNKGSGSLQVLRWMVRHSGAVRAVLGNHDLHLLSVAAGIYPEDRDDSLSDALEAPDRELLLGWLRRCSFIHRDGPWLMVHAGLWPGWGVAEAEELAALVAETLGGSRANSLLSMLAASRKRSWDCEPGGLKRLVVAASILTEIRVAHPEGRLDLGFTGAPAAAPAGFRPWFELSRVPGPETTVLFGHWARLGRLDRPGLHCLDSACVYGGDLSGMILETSEVVTQPVSEVDLPSGLPPPREREVPARSIASG
jgi:bis(5'-nucleosyl)-tetraphosphatase (symmetrical)